MDTTARSDSAARIPLSAEVPRAGVAWGNVVLAAVLMLATLPGRTQGLGLVTEPMLFSLQLDRVVFGHWNLWATLLGAAVCLPIGWLLDRLGIRWLTTVILVSLGAVVLGMSGLSGISGLFVLLFLTRALGQSALSVSSITLAAKSCGSRSEMAMGVYSILFTVLMALAFWGEDTVISKEGWRTAWAYTGIVLICVVAPLVVLFLREPVRVRQPSGPEPTERLAGQTLGEALRAPAFWVFSGAIALFQLASSGLGLWNEDVLHERGFDPRTAHNFLAVTTLFALLGQWLCGWLARRVALPRLLGVAMFLYATCLATLPVVQAPWQLWIFASVFGVSAGFIIVVFFAVWREAFGRAHLGRIQGMAQMLTVFASAIGPLVFAETKAQFHSYAPLLWVLAPLFLAVGFAASRIRLPLRESFPA